MFQANSIKNLLRYGCLHLIGWILFLLLQQNFGVVTLLEAFVLSCYWILSMVRRVRSLIKKVKMLPVLPHYKQACLTYYNIIWNIHVVDYLLRWFYSN